MEILTTATFWISAAAYLLFSYMFYSVLEPIRVTYYPKIKILRYIVLVLLYLIPAILVMLIGWPLIRERM